MKQLVTGSSGKGLVTYIYKLFLVVILASSVWFALLNKIMF
jgi:hypothetical protein